MRRDLDRGDERPPSKSDSSHRTAASYRPSEVAACKGAPECAADVVGIAAIERRSRCETIEHAPVRGHDFCDWLAGNVEHQLVSANARAPQAREILRAFDGA